VSCRAVFRQNEGNIDFYSQTDANLSYIENIKFDTKYDAKSDELVYIYSYKNCVCIRRIPNNYLNILQYNNNKLTSDAWNSIILTKDSPNKPIILAGHQNDVLSTEYKEGETLESFYVIATRCENADENPVNTFIRPTGYFNRNAFLKIFYVDYYIVDRDDFSKDLNISGLDNSNISTLLNSEQQDKIEEIRQEQIKRYRRDNPEPERDPEDFEYEWPTGWQSPISADINPEIPAIKRLTLVGSVWNITMNSPNFYEYNCRA
jgi:hypothetical protein